MIAAENITEIAVETVMGNAGIEMTEIETMIEGTTKIAVGAEVKIEIVEMAEGTTDIVERAEGRNPDSANSPSANAGV